jgi:predicted deacetylase
MFYITFRLDDIVPGMDWGKFNLFYELFKKYQILPLLGVVPNNKDITLNVVRNNTSFWSRLRSLKKEGWLIAQHGYTHIYTTNQSGILGLNPLSEFAGLSYKEQFKKISLGKKILDAQKLSSDIWMAPAHSYDKNTLLALRDSGFKYISDGYSLFPYLKNGLKFIPCQFSFPRKLFWYGVATVCIHSNTSSLEYIKALECFIKDNIANCISYSDAVDISAVNCLANTLSEKIFLNLRKPINALRKFNVR